MTSKEVIKYRKNDIVESIYKRMLKFNPMDGTNTGKETKKLIKSAVDKAYKLGNSQKEKI